MTQVEVHHSEGDAYMVTVDDGASSSSHRVTARPADVARLSEGATAEDVIEASFRFLLDREPKESILSRFDLTAISRYFPDYESKIADYL